MTLTEPIQTAQLEANKDVVRRFVDQVFTSGRTDAIDDLVAPDFESHTWGIGSDDGADGLKAATERVHSGLSDVSFTVDELVAERDLVVALLTSSATPTGDMFGPDTAGKHYEIGELHLFRIRDGRIAEHWHQYDGVGQLKQLGVLPST